MTGAAVAGSRKDAGQDMIFVSRRAAGKAFSRKKHSLAGGSRLFLRRLKWFLAVALLFGLFFYVRYEPELPPGDGSFQLTALDVGQGLAILIEADEHAMLFDGGGMSSSAYVEDYLKRHSVERLDYVFASHYDEDHVGGLVNCIYHLPVDTLVCADYVSDTSLYKSFMEAARVRHLKPLYPDCGQTFALGSALITVLGPVSYDSEWENNKSLVIRVEYGSFSCLLTGDAEYEEESAILASELGKLLDTDLYVVGHHGSSYSSSYALVEATSPRYAVISCGAGNDYGHPTERTLNNLEANGAEIYRTDRQGEIVCFFDGNRVSFSTVSASEQSALIRTYVINTNPESLRFHLPECESAGKISEKNKKLVECSRQELLQQGYRACGYCHP